MKAKIGIFGGGTAAIILVSHINTEKFDIQLFEKNNNLARKFLVAGKGGFNLSHSEPIASLVKRYKPVDFLKDHLLKYNNSDLTKWFGHIGIPTFIGSSKRIFPEEGIKPIQVLEAITRQLKDITINYNSEWVDFGDKNGEILIQKDNQEIKEQFDYVIFSFGGASWAKTGSTGDWLTKFKEASIKTIPFEPSNCAAIIDWDKQLLKEIEGKPLKNISVFKDEHSVNGDVTISKTGLEGSPIYASSHLIRIGLKNDDKAILNIDFKPDNSEEELLRKLNKHRQKSWSHHIKSCLNLSTEAFKIIYTKLSKDDFNNPKKLVNCIKNCPIEIKGLAPIDEAISTVGGIAIDELSTHFELKTKPNHFTIGEMVDWDAPTGGYLIQGCYSMAKSLATYLNSK